MPMRSQVLFGLREEYATLVAARVAAEVTPGSESSCALAIAERDFLAVAEQAARMSSHIIPYDDIASLSPQMADC